MSWWTRLWGSGRAVRPRVRICAECGMPVADHKEWCAILRGQRERELAAQPAPPDA